MKIEERVREGGLFTQTVVQIRITEVRKEDATEVYDALRSMMMWNRGERRRYELCVSGEKINGGEAFERLIDVDLFLSGYELAMQMNGVNVRDKSW